VRDSSQRYLRFGLPSILHYGGLAGGIVKARVGAATVVHADGAVGQRGVFGRGVRNAMALKEHRKARNLEPLAAVARQVY